MLSQTSIIIDEYSLKHFIEHVVHIVENINTNKGEVRVGANS